MRKCLPRRLHGGDDLSLSGAACFQFGATRLTAFIILTRSSVEPIAHISGLPTENPCYSTRTLRLVLLWMRG